MMRQTLTALPVLLWMTTIALGQPSSAEKLFDSTRHDFGTVPRGAQVYHRFRWTNPEKARREITEVRASCACATATPLPRVLEPGGAGVIEVLVDARKFVGAKTVHVHLMIGPDNPQAVVLEIQAHSRADIVYNPGHLNFGVAAEGATPSQTMEIEYAGAFDLKITEVVSPSPHLVAAVEEMYRRPGQIGYRLKVDLKADVPPGDFKQELQLKTNDPSNPVLPVLVEANVRPSVVLVPSPVFFGTVKLQQAVSRRVTIRGDKPFQVLRVEGLGGALSATTPAGAAAVHSLNVTWQPKEAGELNAPLVIYTDLERHPTLRVTLEGESVP